MKQALSLDKINARFLMISFGLMIYAVFSSPTPDSISVFEIVFLVFIFIGIGVSAIVKIATGLSLISKLNFAKLLRISIFYVAFFTWLIVGLVRGWATVDLTRDIVAFCFLFTPVILCVAFNEIDRRRVASGLTWVVSVVGVFFAIRHLHITGFNFSNLGVEFYSEHELYLSTEPSVLFAAIFLVLRAIAPTRATNFTMLVRVLLMLGGVIALVALAAKGHRGPIFLAFGAYLIVFIISIKKSIATVMISLIVATGFAVMMEPQIVSVYDALMKKNESRGINGRDDEFSAVYEVVSKDSSSILLGQGFGSKFRNPAAGGGVVSFAHVSFSWALLKGGLLGFILILIYAATYFRPLYCCAKNDLPLALALSGPFIIGLLINGSYRMLCFGFLLFICLGLGEVGKGSRQHINPNLSAG